jgi:hypothetical protein
MGKIPRQGVPTFCIATSESMAASHNGKSLLLSVGDKGRLAQVKAFDHTLTDIVRDDFTVVLVELWPANAKAPTPSWMKICQPFAHHVHETTKEPTESVDNICASDVRISN